MRHIHLYTMAPPRPPNSDDDDHHFSTSALLDSIILVVVMLSSFYLVFSYAAYLVECFSAILPPFPTIVSHLSNYGLTSPLLWRSIFLAFLVTALVRILVFFEICYGIRGKRCERMGCKGLKNAALSDVLIQDEDVLRDGNENSAVKFVNDLPWRGRTERNPEFEDLRVELRELAPPNGRAVLVFRERCGCPVDKLVGWGSNRRGRRP